MSDVGTWAWAERTGGRMSRGDQFDQVRQGILARLASLPAPWRKKVLGSDRVPDLPEPPDSVLARLAEERVRELSSPSLYGHCLRTWLFAAAFGELDRLDHDEELLYLACVLHDLGLTAAHDGHDPTAACFAVEGARAAQQLIGENGGSPQLARQAAEAISLHLNINVEPALGSEAHLLSKGVSLDAVGRRLDELPRGTVTEVLERFPRGGLAGELSSATHRQGQKRPRSRAALLDRLGFSGLVTNNPLDQLPVQTATPR